MKSLNKRRGACLSGGRRDRDDADGIGGAAAAAADGDEASGPGAPDALARLMEAGRTKKQKSGP